LLEAQAQCKAGHPPSDATAGRCPPIGGTADKVRKILSKIEVRSTRFLLKKEKKTCGRKSAFFLKNEAPWRKFFINK